MSFSIRTVLTATLALLFVSVSSLSAAELTLNGGFETGDTSDWVYFPSTGSTFEITSDANTGSFAAEIFNPAETSGAVVKQANLGVGLVIPGEEISVSFAAKGSFEIGGVAFAEFFSEIDGGGVSKAELFTGAPLSLTDQWQTFNFTTTAGSDVSGGVTLQFAATTGADTGSTARLFIDDVSVSTASIAVPGDFNNDQIVNPADIDLLSAQIGNSASVNPAMNLDNDSTITLADHDAHITTLVMDANGTGALIGDLNLDGDVDVSEIVIGDGGVQNFGDASVLLASLGQTSGQLYADGDLNGDGDVDVSEIVIGDGGVQNFGDASRLLANLGQNTATGAAPATAAVPEPGSLFLVTLSGLAICGMRRRVNLV